MNIIAVDWGTSSFRARHLSDTGKIVDSISNKQGITQIKEGFEKILKQNICNLKGYNLSLPIVMSGMIGSKNGWHETIYTELPCDKYSLASNILKIDSDIGKLYFIPGVAKHDDYPDVLRGEETEIVGAVNLLNIKQATMIIPGTHSKVAYVENGQLVNFKTFLTGEMFAALCKSSILGSFGTDIDISSIWFCKGVEQGYKTKHAGDLLSIIFLARSKVLIGTLPPEKSISYLSGMLIGAEIGASSYISHNIWIMGNGLLPKAYQTALRYLKFEVQLVPKDAIIQGYLSIFNTYLSR